MRIRARLASNTQNRYGYTCSVEELLGVVQWAHNRPLHQHHRPDLPVIGKILSPQLVYDKELDCLVVEADIEIFGDELDGTALKEQMMAGGFSGSYAHGGFGVDESDGTVDGILTIRFDAYHTNETHLYLHAMELSRTLNIPVECVRIRRHAFGEVLAFIGGIIGAYLFEKLLDDLQLYDHLKRFLIETPQDTGAGKHCVLTVVAPEETEADERRLEFHLIGDDAAIEQELDHIRTAGVVRAERVKHFSGPNPKTGKIVYSVESTNAGVSVTQRTTGNS